MNGRTRINGDTKETIAGTLVGVYTLDVPGERPVCACPRCGIRRQVRKAGPRLCQDCRLVDPDFLTRGARAS